MICADGMLPGAAPIEIGNRGESITMPLYLVIPKHPHRGGDLADYGVAAEVEARDPWHAERLARDRNPAIGEQPVRVVAIAYVRDVAPRGWQPQPRRGLA
jgi:hypothetical protein